MSLLRLFHQNTSTTRQGQKSNILSFRISSPDTETTSSQIRDVLIKIQHNSLNLKITARSKGVSLEKQNKNNLTFVVSIIFGKNKEDKSVRKYLYHLKYALYIEIVLRNNQPTIHAYMQESVNISMFSGKVVTRVAF